MFGYRNNHINKLTRNITCWIFHEFETIVTNSELWTPNFDISSKISEYSEEKTPIEKNIIQYTKLSVFVGQLMKKKKKTTR